MNISAIQAVLRERKFDAWLFYDHHHRDPIAYGVLGLRAELMVTRRWYYLIPADGEPQKLVHRIEAGHLDTLPGTKQVYSGWQEQQANLQAMLKPYKNVAMQYSPNNLIPYIGLVDAGTVELIRSFGVNVQSSANLVAQFEAALTEAQIATHFEARDSIDAITAEAFKEIGRRVRSGGTHEFEIQQFLMECFRRENLETDDPPIVGVNAHSGDPHYEPRSETSSPIKNGDFVLLDIWGKKKKPGAVYYDITWTGCVGTPTARHQEIFRIVRDARKAAVEKAKEAFAAKRLIHGWEVDDAARETITKSGYGEYFVHRTGHSIGVNVHANGANMDNLETKDDREIIPNTLFSVEPGIYLPEFGVRSEVNVLIRNGAAEVTGAEQEEIVTI